MRHAYYKESATLVQQPMVDARFDAGDGTEVQAHMLVDVITSASVAAGQDGEEFTERRYEGGGSYQRELFGRLRLGAGGRYSTESDYTSLFGNVRAALDLAQRNTTIAGAFAIGRDTIGNQQGGGISDPFEEQLDTYLGSLSFTQVLSPKLVGGVTYDLLYNEGYLENPYRTVFVAGIRQPENIPDSRLRHAIFGSLRGYVEETDTIVIAGYRFYTDDFGIRSHTPELRVIQQLREDVDIRARYRFYVQNSADFYRDRYDSPQRFVTDDPKLGAFTTHTAGLQLTGLLRSMGATGLMAKARGELLLEYVAQDNRFGDAVIAQLALTLPFEY